MPVSTAGFLGSPPSAVVTSVTLTIVSSVVLAANPNRRGFILYNNSGTIMFVAFAATTATASFTLRLLGNERYESPLNGYTGVVSGITSGGSGAIRVTEIIN